MKSPLQIKTVRGTPIRVYGRTFVPIARVISLVKHRATIRKDGYNAAGWGGVWVQPLAVVEYDGNSDREPGSPPGMKVPAPPGRGLEHSQSSDRELGSPPGMKVPAPPSRGLEHFQSRAHTMLIPDRTSTVLREMAIVALALPVLCLAVISLARRMRNR